MASKKAAKPKRTGRAGARHNAAGFGSLPRVVGRNLANMAIVVAASGSVLLCLLIAKRFV